MQTSGSSACVWVGTKCRHRHHTIGGRHLLLTIWAIRSPAQGFRARAGRIMLADRRPPGRRGITVLNRYDHRSAPGEAEIRYLDGDFRVVRPGAFVRCAVTGVAIPLEELKYWSVERQEPYASPDAVLQRLYPGRAK